MIQHPTAPYAGLTVFLDKPSRLNGEHLIYGMSSSWFEESCIAPLRIAEIELRDIESFGEALRRDTRYIAFLGPKVCEAANILYDPPGYPHIYNRILATSAFDPQVCNDHKSFGAEEDDDDDTSSDRDTKERIPTRRKNYRFWTAWHLQKLLRPSPAAPPRLIADIYPSLTAVVRHLEHINNECIYLDIETSRSHRCLTCVGLSSDSIFPRTYVVPIYLHNGDAAYSCLHLFIRALSRALSRNTVVIHNSGFDVPVLTGWYKVHLPRNIYDTMIANHRCFPEAEKSLAHVISQWTNQIYHKDQNTEVYNAAQERQLWNYNAKDVYNLKLIRDAQLAHAATVPGLLSSIEQANSSLVPYIDTTLTGLRLDQIALSEKSQQLERAKALYTRIAQILTGNAMFNPGSSKQCIQFFHERLHYDVVARTEQGAPSLGAKALYQLQLKYPNPLIPVIIKYRVVAKDLGMLESELLTLPGT